MVHAAQRFRCVATSEFVTELNVANEVTRKANPRLFSNNVKEMEKREVQGATASPPAIQPSQATTRSRASSSDAINAKNRRGAAMLRAYIPRRMVVVVAPTRKERESAWTSSSSVTASLSRVKLLAGNGRSVDDLVIPPDSPSDEADEEGAEELDPPAYSGSSSSASPQRSLVGAFAFPGDLMPWIHNGLIFSPCQRWALTGVALPPSSGRRNNKQALPIVKVSLARFHWQLPGSTSWSPGGPEGPSSPRPALYSSAASSICRSAVVSAVSVVRDHPRGHPLSSSLPCLDNGLIEILSPPDDEAASDDAQRGRSRHRFVRTATTLM